MFMDDVKYGWNSCSQEMTAFKIATVCNFNKKFVFGSDISMDFGIEKCAVVVMKRRRLAKSGIIKFIIPDGRKFRNIRNDHENYKYLGVLEAM